MVRKALIVKGGWDGHEPDKVAEIFRRMLVAKDFSVEVSDTLDAFKDAEKLKKLNLVIPLWTMSDLTHGLREPNPLAPVLKAVEGGVGIAGCHGGMCDAFRQNVEWQFMTGGQFVNHPGEMGLLPPYPIEYKVNIRKGAASPIIEGIDDFTVTTEQYYMHVDPAVQVLATTRFPVFDGPHASNGSVDMPVVWTKLWGKGRVFYCSLGHKAEIFDKKEVYTLMERGFLWAAGAR